MVTLASLAVAFTNLLFSGTARFTSSAIFVASADAFFARASVTSKPIISGLPKVYQLAFANSPRNWL